MKMRRMVALIMTVVVLASNSNMKIWANDSNSGIELEDNSFPNLEKNYDEDSLLCKKLEYDVENDVTDLSPKKEERLNTLGVFDEDIQKLDDKSVEKIEAANNIEVTIDYVQINEFSEYQEEMSNEKVDNIIEEQIEEEKLDYEEENNIFNDVLTKIGILPANVKAAAPVAKDSKYGKSSSGAMKQIIYACQHKKGGKIEVIATAIWLKDAYYKNKDVFGVSIKNGTPRNDNSKCYHTGTLKFYYGGKWNSRYYSTNPTSIKRDTDGIAYRVNLFGTRGVGVLANRDAGYFENETITITFDCDVDNTRIKKVVFVPHYQHLQTNKNFATDVGISLSGLSMGLSGSSANYYYEISNNPILQFKYAK